MEIGSGCVNTSKGGYKKRNVVVEKVEQFRYLYKTREFIYKYLLLVSNDIFFAALIHF